MDTKYEHKGYKYQPIVDVEPLEVVKIFHYVINPSGERIYFDCSPYYKPTESDFKTWVDLGCPKRIKGNFLETSDIRKVASQQ